MEDLLKGCFYVIVTPLFVFGGIYIIVDAMMYGFWDLIFLGLAMIIIPVGTIYYMSSNKKRKLDALLDAKAKSIIETFDEYEKKLSELRAKYGDLTKEINLTKDIETIRLDMVNMPEPDDNNSFLKEYEKYKKELFGKINSEYKFTDLSEFFSVVERAKMMLATERDIELEDAKKIIDDLVCGINNKIIVFEQSSTLLIQNAPHNFDNIIDFEVYNNSRSIYSGATESGRGGALVGGLLFGVTGAIIGASGKRGNTGTTTTANDYDVVLTLNNLSEPALKINFASNQNGVQEFVSILSIIFRQRNKTNQ